MTVEQKLKNVAETVSWRNPVARHSQRNPADTSAK